MNKISGFHIKGGQNAIINTADEIEIIINSYFPVNGRWKSLIILKDKDDDSNNTDDDEEVQIKYDLFPLFIEVKQFFFMFI